VPGSGLALVVEAAPKVELGIGGPWGIRRQRHRRGWWGRRLARWRVAARWGGAARQRGHRHDRRWQAGGDGGAALEVEDDGQAGMETRVALDVEDD
jgi:hypothetical protein